MSGSSFGTIFRMTTWGESHGPAIGVVVDGCPAGLPLEEADIQALLDRRKPGQSKFTTSRRESDSVSILSGVFEGKTTGTPISMEVRNTNQRSGDYSEIASYYRPGHADYTFNAKYGFRDYTGGGRSSGRETIGRVAAGAIAMKLLSSLGIQIIGYAAEIGGIAATAFHPEEIEQNPFRMADTKAAEQVAACLQENIRKQDSVGGIIECMVTGLPAGLGDPVFEKLDANLAKAICSIGAVKGFEIGDGFAAARAFGSTNNDAFSIENGTVSKKTNHAGGILGGISDGSPLILRAAIKPTPSISALQQTINTDGEEIDIRIKGRHDPVIVPRAVVVIEAMTAMTIADALLMNMSSRLDAVQKFYQK